MKNLVLTCMTEHERIGSRTQISRPHETPVNNEVEPIAVPACQGPSDGQPSGRHQTVSGGPQPYAPPSLPAAGASEHRPGPLGVPPEHRLLTAAEAAAYFQVTERTVEAWRAKRLLPFRKVGRTIRYKLADLLQALDDRFLVRRRQQ